MKVTFLNKGTDQKKFVFLTLMYYEVTFSYFLGVQSYFLSIGALKSFLR